MDRMIEAPPEPPQPVFSAEQILAAQNLLPKLHLADPVKDYILDITRGTRPSAQSGEAVSGEMKRIQGYLDFGGSPRATLALNRAARAHALLEHRAYVIPDDVKAVAPDVLRHRITPSYRAEAEGLSADDLIVQILSAVDIP